MVAKKVLAELSKESSRSLHSEGSSLSEDSQRPMVQGRYMRGLIGKDGKGGNEEEVSEPSQCCKLRLMYDKSRPAMLLETRPVSRNTGPTNTVLQIPKTSPR